MNFITEKSKQIPVADRFDVAVCGGGIAGISAALSAARENKKVILIENQFMPGGLATAGLVTIFLPLCDGEGHQVSYGICEELIRLSVKYGYEDEPIPNVWCGEHTAEERAKAKRYRCQYNPQVFAILCEQLLLSFGVKILYGSRVCDVLRDSDRISDIVVENKGGRIAYSVGAVVDTTGDADICKLAQVPTVEFGQGNSLAAWHYTLKNGKYNLHMCGFSDVPDESGKYAQSSENTLSNKRYYGLDGDDLSGMSIAAHKTILEQFLKGGQANENRALATIATIPQIRMTRKIVGEYELAHTEMHTYFEDSIGMVSNWKKRGPVYEVPFRTLYNRDMKNLIVAGRCTSVNETLWDVMRVIPCCAVTGQAAGIAATMTDDFSTLDVALLQQKLRENGVVIHEKDLQ